ncbi:MAG TPA: hypothetical protein PLL36_00315 [Candidatus Hydrogenedentes bacterium]|nr:hypothetical protein [Candidatus Hydrogenedentota bacterium]HQM99483.1 hypothetical protein [Candidatus Hydrogenedentota bacterium]
MFQYYDRNSGAFQLMNTSDDLKQGMEEEALESPEVFGRDKAGLE